jgi:2-octaprenyl-6-methoxyphenol hydroxylase
MVLVGDAGHGIHPIAGQGLNMGLRDVETLSDLVARAVRDAGDPGADGLLDTYARLRRGDNMAMGVATDTLNRLFSNRVPGLGIIRRLGLRGVQASGPARRFFMYQAMGLNPRLKPHADRRDTAHTKKAG